MQTDLKQKPKHLKCLKWTVTSLAWWCGLEYGLGPDSDKNTMTHRRSYNE